MVRLSNKGYTEWGPLVKDLIIQGADLHFISSEGRTPFSDLLGELLLETSPPAVEDSEPIDLVSEADEMEPNNAQTLSLLLRTWLGFLQESGVDLEEYGRKEADLQLQGLVSWMWSLRYSSSYAWYPKTFTYGPSPSDWKIAMGLRLEDVAESPIKMPGGWIEDE